MDLRREKPSQRVEDQRGPKRVSITIASLANARDRKRIERVNDKLDTQLRRTNAGKKADKLPMPNKGRQRSNWPEKGDKLKIVSPRYPNGYDDD